MALLFLLSISPMCGNWHCSTVSDEACGDCSAKPWFTSGEPTSQFATAPAPAPANNRDLHRSADSAPGAAPVAATGQRRASVLEHRHHHLQQQHQSTLQTALQKQLPRPQNSSAWPASCINIKTSLRQSAPTVEHLGIGHSKSHLTAAKAARRKAHSGSAATNVPSCAAVSADLYVCCWHLSCVCAPVPVQSLNTIGSEVDCTRCSSPHFQWHPRATCHSVGGLQSLPQ